jgi:hypothetical protein
MHLLAVSNGYSTTDKNEEAIKDIPIFCIKLPIYPSRDEFFYKRSSAGRVKIALRPEPITLICQPLYNPSFNPSSICVLLKQSNVVTYNL